MTQGHDLPYLRLVTTCESIPSFGRDSRTRMSTPGKPKQLMLPFLDPFTMVLINVESIRVEQFANLLQSLRPRWVIDVRATPRLDVLGGTRNHAFKLFDMYGAEYMDVFGQLGLLSYRSVEANPALWSFRIGEIIRASDKPTGPFLGLFDNLEFMDESASTLPSSLNNYLGHPISLSIMKL